jgi:hypothetical protein
MKAKRAKKRTRKLTPAKALEIVLTLAEGSKITDWERSGDVEFTPEETAAFKMVPQYVRALHRQIRVLAANAPRVEVRHVAPKDPLGESMVMVNGFGIASWRSNGEARGFATGREYAEEVGRVLRIALGVIAQVSSS